MLPSCGRADITAQQVDLGAALVRQPVVAVRRPSGQRVDQRRGLSRVPDGEKRLSSVCNQGCHYIPVPQAGLPGSLKAAQGHLGGVLELREPEQRIAFDHGQPYKRWAVFRGLSKNPSALKEGEPFLDLLACERIVGQACQDTRDQRCGTGVFGDLQRPVQGWPGSVEPVLEGDQEGASVVQQCLGVVR